MNPTIEAYEAERQALVEKHERMLACIDYWDDPTRPEWAERETAKEKWRHARDLLMLKISYGMEP